MISRTRSGFNLLFNENRNYGYERNLYGLKKLGRSVAGATLVCSAIAVGFLIGVAHRKTRAEWIIGLIALSALAMVWIFLPSEKRTRRTAFKYAGNSSTPQLISPESSELHLGDWTPRCLQRILRVGGSSLKELPKWIRRV